MLANMRLAYIRVFSDDLETSSAFYKDRLGLRVVDELDHSVVYDAGQVMIWLSSAADEGVSLWRPKDKSANITFLVPEVDRVRAGLEYDGVEFPESFRYQVGAIHDLYDPDGHWISLYEPSEEALGWPSGRKIRGMLKASANGATNQNGATNHSDTQDGGLTGNSHKATERWLENSPVVYLFFFVGDPDIAYAFYHETLGLPFFESRPCRRGSTAHERGVIKYDVGSLILTTHHVHSSDAGQDADSHSDSSSELDPARMRGIAPVFHADNLEEAVGALSQRGIALSQRISRTLFGDVAAFDDPFGHRLYLCQPTTTYGSIERSRSSGAH